MSVVRVRLLPVIQFHQPPTLTRHSAAPKGHSTAAQGNALGGYASMIPEPCKGGLIRAALSSTLGDGDPIDVETGESLRGVVLRTALGVRSPFQGFRIGAGPTQGVALGCGRMPLWDGRPGRIAPILKGIGLQAVLGVREDRLKANA